MHDPRTLAFSIKSPFKSKSGYQPSLIDIWHVDPDKGYDDDSCGWFIRERHMNKKNLEFIRRDFEYSYKEWYYESNGLGRFSPHAIAIMMYNRAVWELADGNTDFKSKTREVFMRKYLYDILYFSENSTDSICRTLTSATKGEVVDLAGIIAADVARKLRPWYKHPRWHIHHWEIRFNFYYDFYRGYIQKCDNCGKRGWKGGWFRTYKNGKPLLSCGRCQEIGCKSTVNS
jgi:hypothetical protein